MKCRHCSTFGQKDILPLGRVAIFKSVILSKLVHLWILLPDPLDDFVNNLQKMCFKFNWNNKQDTKKKRKKRTKKKGAELP